MSGTSPARFGKCGCAAAPRSGECPRRRPDAAYDRLGPEFVLARTLIEARRSAALTQAELAERMETTQSVVARLESGRIHPSTRTLEKIARATGTRLRISFDPA